LCLWASSLGYAQWSPAVTVAESLSPFGAGPELVSLQGDTVWAFWIHGPMPSEPRLMARCFFADTWRTPELVASSPEGLFWPAAASDDSGRLAIAFHEGNYPIQRTAAQDTWGIYTTFRTDTGWVQPELAHATMMDVFPFRVELALDRHRGTGMVWDERGGGTSGMDSVMFSRKSQSGWTPRKCLAPGRYPDVYCSHASLVPGDSSDFVVAFWRLTSPGTDQVEVRNLDDSLLPGGHLFAGTYPVLARSEDAKFIIFRREDTLFASVNRGSGWLPEEPVAARLGFGTPALCTDPMGWAWTCWPDSAHRTLLASYNSGSAWSVPETVATFSSLGNPAIASDAQGRMHCVWFDHAPGTQGRLRHAVRLGRPGIEGRENREVRMEKAGATVVRGVLELGSRLTANGLRPELLDAAGRRVMELAPGANDVSHLAPGVYFVRAPGFSGRRLVVSRVVIAR